ncbi:ATP-dependent DNA helicase RecG, partial [Chloroflexota bacterium]
MALDFTPLRKVLQLEHKKGYSDSAVFGGLDRFLSRWSAQSEPYITNLTLLKRFKKLNNISYASLDEKQRLRQVENILAFIEDIEQNPPPKGETKPVIKPNPTTPGPKAVMASVGANLDSPVTAIKGISAGMAVKFGKLGVYTIRDLLYFFPRRHIDYSRMKTISELTEGNEESIIANIWQVRQVMLGRRRSTEAIVGDETGNVRVVWFNNPYIVKQLATNKKVVISGRLGIFKGLPVFESPEWELLEDKDLTHTGRLVPVYPLTRGLYPRSLRKLMKGIINGWAGKLEEFMPLQLRQKCNLIGLTQAISQAHFPDDEESKDSARIRLAFDELFLLQLGVINRKYSWQEDQPANAFTTDTPVLDIWLKSLPFTLTNAQNRVIKKILEDLQKTRPMSRLLQGEVGSGKTAVAVASLLTASASGYQAAFMAPTEILAGQHFSGICRLMDKAGRLEVEEDYLHSYSGLIPRPLTVALLTGDIKGKRKKELQQRILNGDIDIVIGTHALIQKDVSFSRLGLVIVDEQHRFGVTQRSTLRQKGFNPHVLAMTATPIPRTLALTLYGDLDLSVIDELPPGRQTIKTKWLKPAQRNSGYSFLRKQIAEGRQAFIICPLIEESEAIQARAAIAEFEYLSQQVFPDLKLELLHGRMSSKDKDGVMKSFRQRHCDILVSTPVVEVGIDIPNASVMFIESADRFGLSQLHQFRGRVGRGEEQSYCLLLAENPSGIARQRLDIIEKIDDGFRLAEEDLKLRGPGEFFGTRQSGIPDLRMAKISDVGLLERVRGEAIELFEK